MRELSDQVIAITGATSGLGRYLAGELAAAGASLVVHGRDTARLHQLQRELTESGGGRAQVRTVLADLADLQQVDRLADELLEGAGGDGAAGDGAAGGPVERIDVLVNNAGIGFGAPGTGRETSAQGLELRFAVNYLAGYHLTRRLIPLLVASAPARVVNVSSIGQEPLDPEDPQFERGYSGRAAYRRSKLAQIMFTFDLADELAAAGVTANALHPATFMDTAMVRELGGTPLSTVEEGGAATLRLIASRELEGVTGHYFDGNREAQANAQAYDAEARAWLRQLSDQLVRDALVPDRPSPTG